MQFVLQFLNTLCLSSRKKFSGNTGQDDREDDERKHHGTFLGKPAFTSVWHKKSKLSSKLLTLFCLKTVKAVLPQMMERNHGHIVSIASIAGFAPCNGMTDYCASKYAAVGFNDALELELHAAGSAVRTTVVCPYFINTGMFDGCQTRYYIQSSTATCIYRSKNWTYIVSF